ncbi:MAG: hypothetical protein WD669_02395 [Pirellulales bacterium]
MPVIRNTIEVGNFNKKLKLPYNLRVDDFHLAMQDVYDFFFDVNALLEGKGLERLYDIDIATEPARNRRPMNFVEVYLGQVTKKDFRRNERGELGTRTATLHAAGLKTFRQSWLYRSERG